MVRRTLLRTLLCLGCTGALYAQVPIDSSISHPNVFSEPAAARSTDLIYLSYAQFHIPFSIDRSGALPASVNLYVSTDGGNTWQHHGKASPEAGRFEFRAAAEGEYLFTVQTVDSAGVAFPSSSPPMRVHVDTTKPEASLHADLDTNGNLIVDFRVFDQFLDPKSAMLRVRTDRESRWREVLVENLSVVGDHVEGQVELILPPCREVLMIFSVMDTAKNSTEVSHRFTMPRTAAGASDLQLASTGNGIGVAGVPSVPGAIAWEPDASPASGFDMQGPGRLAHSSSVGPYAIASPSAEEIAPPQPETLPRPVSSSRSGYDTTSVNGEKEAANVELNGSTNSLGASDRSPPSPPDNPTSSRTTSTTSNLDADSQNPYYCKTRAFSLDYSVDALGGDMLSQVELWGTEDGGLTWQKWGVDPDRVSPFDVKVGNDGLFGFRMVVVGRDGYVLGQPKPGEKADVWIYVDTETPSCRITRAVYGEGSEAGMLVIDYSCIDSQLADQCITLSYSQSSDGPWTTLAHGLRNTGLYLWKVEPNVPNRVYLKMEAVDKAGNIGTYRLDLPIDIQGLSPRGRIQGFRPIVE